MRQYSYKLPIKSGSLPNEAPIVNRDHAQEHHSKPVLPSQICDLPMSKRDSGGRNECNRRLTSTSTPSVCVDGRIGNRRFQLPIKGDDEAIQRAALFLTRAHIRSMPTRSRNLIYLVANASHCICKSGHDAKKLDNCGKVRIEWVLVLGR